MDFKLKFLKTLFKVIFLLLLCHIQIGCGIDKKKKGPAERDSVTVEIDSALIHLSDTTWNNPDGTPVLYRNAFVTNNTQHSIILEKPFADKRIIKLAADIIFFRKYKIWDNPVIIKWEEKNDYFTLKPGAREKFLIADPFHEGDSAGLILDVGLDTTQKRIYRYRHYFYIDRKKGVFPMDETPVSLKNQKRKE